MCPCSASGQERKGAPCLVDKSSSRAPCSVPHGAAPARLSRGCLAQGSIEVQFADVQVQLSRAELCTLSLEQHALMWQASTLLLEPLQPGT